MRPFPGDLINWPDQMMRYLGAIEAAAKVLVKGEEARKARGWKRLVEGGVRSRQIIYSSAIV